MKNENNNENISEANANSLDYSEKKNNPGKILVIFLGIILVVFVSSGMGAIFGFLALGVFGVDFMSYFFRKFRRELQTQQ
jgi:flagellar basal body-associated protein FliL